MMNFDIRWLFPRFLLHDRTGFAMARAIEAALKYFLNAAEDGLDAWGNVDKMPEWRLDEMARELGCLYDFNADEDAKRRWIRDAVPLFFAYGTPQAILNFLTGVFDTVELEENWQYGGDPYHFRVTVSGEWTPESEAWARKAIAAAKNVRSVLDGMRIGCDCYLGILTEAETRGRFAYPLTGTENWAGRWPMENVPAVFERPMAAALPQDATGRVYYKMCGLEEIGE